MLIFSIFFVFVFVLVTEGFQTMRDRKESAHDHTIRRRGDEVLDKLRIMAVIVFCIIATCSVLQIY